MSVTSPEGRPDIVDAGRLRIQHTTGALIMISDRHGGVGIAPGEEALAVIEYLARQERSNQGNLRQILTAGANLLGADRP